MAAGLTPEQRTLRGRLAAQVRWSAQDPVEGTARARAASPSSLAYFEAKVDPTGELPDAERLRRAESARRAYFTRLALASSRARRRGGDAA